MDDKELASLIAKGESLELEFKSDSRRGFSDKEIYDEIVAMANTNGGILLIGVEDDGVISGCRPRNGSVTDVNRLKSAIFNNTVPSINTRVSVVYDPKGDVLVIQVDPYPEICSTASGKTLRRVIGSDGKPATVPYYARDQVSRRVDLGHLDFSSLPVDGATIDDLDPLEFERVRQAITNLRGDRTLLELPNEELAKALRLVETRNGTLVPNVAGILLLGHLSSIQRFLPTHTVHFQVLDIQGDVRVNDAFYEPIVKIIEEIESRFKARNEEREKIVGLLRYPIPDYSPVGFREAVNNALLHRDYSRMESVYIQWHHDHILITNPGGFPEGITSENILVHEPKPRNIRLAEAFKRIGIIEQTGRGVDKIYMEQVRYGRPPPDYSRSDSLAVRVEISGGESSLDFAAFIYEEKRDGKVFSLDELLILNTLYYDRPIDESTAGSIIQKGTTQGRRVLEQLHERGLVEVLRKRSGNVYHLSAALNKRLHAKSEYLRSKDIDKNQQEKMIIAYVEEHGKITRSDAMDLLDLNGYQATRVLKRISEENPRFKKVGETKGTYYIWENV
ncbi:RNA-binding domain-containing protein [Methanocalculus sp.]|uniref:RNA-binding domain-containing protein n=1 Tax=Methanocalculus sp. TaxID=2004547 RepID=UPI0026118ADB|nr:RNA-binding domain-containing protein [Methanocalculus sp.]MDG6250411.1 ATP-binding protein [Methanocalculus sp.]